MEHCCRSSVNGLSRSKSIRRDGPHPITLQAREIVSQCMDNPHSEFGNKVFFVFDLLFSLINCKCIVGAKFALFLCELSKLILVRHFIFHSLNIKLTKLAISQNQQKRISLFTSFFQNWNLRHFDIGLDKSSTNKFQRRRYSIQSLYPIQIVT